MARVLLPLQPEEKHDLELLRAQTHIPLGVLVYLRKQGYSPISTEVARQHGLLSSSRQGDACVAAFSCASSTPTASDPSPSKLRSTTPEM